MSLKLLLMSLDSSKSGGNRIRNSNKLLDSIFSKIRHGQYDDELITLLIASSAQKRS
jgi:hypothetical protein